MKVIKRDGRAVEYNSTKILIAIEKANKEVSEEKRISKKEILQITNYIETLDKKRILVEDIQDIIEQKLMELKKYDLAKKYIVYRYTRALVRKQNTTDESILGLIKNTNNIISHEEKYPIIASAQRNLIAAEVSKDLTKRMLLPEKITKAHENGILYFHSTDYFLQPINNSCLVNIEDMLDNGTVINGKLIESPKCFQVACIVMTQIIAAVASSQYGEQSINIKHLGKYLRKSREKLKKELETDYTIKLEQNEINSIIEKKLRIELIAGVQTIQYQINTLMTTNNKPPLVNLFLDLDEEDEFIEENAMIIEEILKQRYEGMKNENGQYIEPKFPKMVYVLYEYNCLKGGKYDYITRLALKCSLRTLYPTYISAKKMKENYEGNVFSPIEESGFLSPWKDENGDFKFEGRFNQGIVSVNLPQIGIIADGDEDRFWKLLDERLELCYEALMCRHYALLGTVSDISPLHWKYGAIAHLKSGEKIDRLLKNGYSSISLGYVGLYEVTQIMKGVSYTEKEGHDFAINIMKHLKLTVDKWKKETEIDFLLYGVQGRIGHKFAKIDKEKFGEIKSITHKGYYTNFFNINEKEIIDIFEKLKFESEFQDISLGSNISHVEISNIKSDIKKMEELVNFAYENIQYVGFRDDTTN